VLGGLVLRLQLGAVEALRAQFPRTHGVGPGLGSARRQFGDGGARLGHFAGHRVVGNAGEHLAFLNHVADVSLDGGDAVVGDLGTDHRFLPGDDVAVGGQRARPVFVLRGDGSHRQRRLAGRRCGLGRGCLAAGGEGECECGEERGS
jgi:hypothetical protein